MITTSARSGSGRSSKAGIAGIDACQYGRDSQVGDSQDGDSEDGDSDAGPDGGPDRRWLCNDTGIEADGTGEPGCAAQDGYAHGVVPAVYSGDLPWKSQKAPA